MNNLASVIRRFRLLKFSALIHAAGGAISCAGRIAGMDEPRRSGLIPIAVVVVALVVPTIYLVAYIELGTAATCTIGPRSLNVRVYSREWQERLFRPAAKVESALSGREIETAHRTN